MSANRVVYRYLNIVGFTVDATQPLALFKDESQETTFPLWLEMMDVLSITADLITSRFSGRGEKKDLFEALIETLEMKVVAVLIDGRAGSGYSAVVCFDYDGAVVKVKVELVTALLTAIRYKLSVGISEEALSTSSFVDQSIDADIDIDIDDDKRLLEMLERMTPEEMNKYPL
ncbi:MAG: bifunctional nuclease family protein [Geobacteraceae bacterium]|nr:bifunctional nuclease family protein [Geobacteraceae bacterium]